MSQRLLKGAASVVVLAAGLAAAASPAMARTHGVGCSQAAVQAAMNHGGTYDFTANCTISVTHSLAKQYGSVTLAGNGHTVIFTGTPGLKTAAFNIDGGHLTLEDITVEDVTITGHAGASGQSGKSYANTATGASGGLGGSGLVGESVDGAGLYAAPGSVVTLIDDTFDRDVADAGNGGNGGAGGDGDSGVPTASSGLGPGGVGGNGGPAGSGGSALGGAVYSAGALTVIGGTFRDDVARGGAGGDGGTGGNGGNGGASSSSVLGDAGGQGGQGGEGGDGGDGGAAHGAGIYAAGTVSVSGASFIGDQAVGGAAGNGSHGGNGGIPETTQQDGGGTGGNGGNGGDGGAASGAGLFASNRGVLSAVHFRANRVIGGAVGPNCPTSGTGCGGSGGTGAANTAATTGTAEGGFAGTEGSAGTATDANSSVRLTGAPK